jgi:trk system potassium uptake protein TrkH
MNVLLGVAAVVAVVSIVLQYGGFNLDRLGLSVAVLHRIQQIIVGWFILDRLLRLGLARQRLRYLRENWLDFVLIALFFAAVAITWQYRPKLLAAGVLFVIITQGYLLAVVLLRGVSANIILAGSGLPPSWLLIASFAGLALVGSGLLMLPAAVRPEFYSDWYYDQALFTAVSATCVTGLIVVDTGTHFTPFGQAVILVLIQLGGLGIMIFGSVLALLMGKSLSIRSTQAIGQMLAYDRAGDLARLARFIVGITLLTELVGAVFLTHLFMGEGVYDAWGQPLTTLGAIWHGVFHSVSAFCNAGFSLYTYSMMHGANGQWAQPLRDHWQVMGVMAPLIIVGGIGFPVLSNLWAWLRERLDNVWTERFTHNYSISHSPRNRLSLHTKIVLATTAVLIPLGAIGLLLVEVNPPPRRPSRYGSDVGSVYHSDWQQLDSVRRMRAAVFQSISARTAGFNTIDMNDLTDSGKLWLCGLMIIGGNPASTAGGVKTTTVAVIVLAAGCVLRRRRDIEVFGRRLDDLLLRRAVTLMLLYLLLVGTVALLLSISMRSEQFIDVLFEACSACGTVGLSTGVTTRIGVFEELLISAGMFIGRVGPLTAMLALTVHLRKVNYSYPTATVEIG